MALTDKLTAIAEAIRSKTGSTDAMNLEDMTAAIESIAIGTHTMTGSFIPAEVISTYTIELPGEASSFVLVKRSTSTVSGQRNVGMASFFGDLSKGVSCYTNYSGTSWGSLSLESTDISISGSVVAFNGRTAYLVPEEYDWIAW